MSKFNGCSISVRHRIPSWVWTLERLMATLFFRSIGPSFTVHLQSLEALDAGGNEPRHTSFS